MVTNTSTPTSNAAVALFQPITHPVLCSVDPVKVSAFIRERERYDLLIQKKKNEVPTLTAATYTACIYRALLRNMHFLGRFKAVAPSKTVEQLSFDDIKAFIQGLIKQTDAGYDPKAIDKALYGIRMNNNIANAEARVLHFANAFFERMDAIGYGSFRTTNPKKTIPLMNTHTSPTKLREVMERKLEFDQSLKADVQRFVLELSTEDIACQTYNDLDRLQHTTGRISKPTKGAQKTKQSKRTERTPPLCLLPAHKQEEIRHWLSDCDACDDNKRAQLRADYKTNRPSTPKGSKLRQKPRRCQEPQRHHLQYAERSSVLFGETFGNRVRDVIIADIGADVNIMDNKLLTRLQRAGADVTITDLARPLRYAMPAGKLPSGEESQILCHKIAIMPIERHVRHGCTLVLRNVRWVVTEQRVGEPLFGRPTFEDLGLHAKEILAIAADRLNGDIDLKDIHSDLETDTPGKVAMLTRDGVFHSDRGVDNLSDDGGSWLDIGEDGHREKADAIAILIKNAVSNGISNAGATELRSITENYDDVLRIRLGPGPPANVDPIRVDLTPGCRPVGAGPRLYLTSKREFLQRVTGKLLYFGFLEITNEAQWVAAPLIVPKNPPEMFRLTVDLRAVNAATQPMLWPMPNIDAELSDMRGSKVFASIYFVSGYWQLPLAPQARLLHAFMTDNAVVMLTRTLQGACNSAANFQGKVELCFATLREWLKAWIGDFALHNPAEKDLLRVIWDFIDICRKVNLKVSIPKSIFFLQKLEWCGRVIDKDGVTFQPARISGLQDCIPPQTAAELCELVHCVGWMAPGIPNFMQRIACLRELLEIAHKRSNKRAKKSIAKYTVQSLGWTEAHTRSFEDIQQQLRNKVQLSHRDTSQKLCIYSDAIELFWASIVMQCPETELEKAHEDQKHEPLAFLSGEFKGPQLGWKIYEKESLSIVETFHRLDYMLQCEQNTRIFTDHRNLLFVFSPSSLEPALGRHKVLKPRAPTARPRAVALDKDFEWPSIDTLHIAQAEHQEKRPAKALQNEEGAWRINERAWIQDDADDAQLRLLIIANCGYAGHRGADTTADTLCEFFTWSTIQADTRAFVDDCIHCIMAKTGSKTPRQFSTTLHGTRPNQVFHFDFLYMGPTAAGLKYLLILKDDLSSYLWL